MKCFICPNEVDVRGDVWLPEKPGHRAVYLCSECWDVKTYSEKQEQIYAKFDELNKMQAPETPLYVTEEQPFNVKIIADINTVEISGYGFTAEIKQGLAFNQATGQYFTKYSVLFERQVIALSQAELRKYIMFLEYLEFYLENLNA